jgi:uncharacterized membrane protein
MAIHPFLVHFPIAFLLLAPVVDGVDRWRPGLAFRSTADLLYLLGAAGAVAAATAGQSAFDRIGLSGVALALAERHQNAGNVASWLAVAAGMGRLFDRLRARKSGGAGTRAAHLVAVVLGLAAAAAIAWAGLLGGKLVHELGVTPATAPRRAAAVGSLRDYTRPAAPESLFMPPSGRRPPSGRSRW